MTTGYVRGFAPSDKPRTSATSQNKYVAKGHDAQLQNAMYSKSIVRLQILGKDRTAIGLITKRDKFTITLSHTVGDLFGMDEIFYKHAIESVLIEKSSDQA